MKAFTDLEQSKKLAEILPINTADMCWTNHCYGVIRSSMTISAKTVNEYKSLLDRFNDSTSIDVFYPAWSLSALLGLMPITCILNISNGHYRIASNETNTFFHDNPIDAAFEMVVWLKENGKI